MLYLKDTPINQILSMNEMIEAVEDTLKEVALGRGFELPRRRIHHPNRMIFGLLPGSVHGAMGAYLQTDLDRRIHHETVILYSVETGAPLILFQDCAMNENRTAAAGAIGAKYLARANANRVAVFGSADPRGKPTQSGRRRQKLDASVGFQPKSKAPRVIRRETRRRAWNSRPSSIER